MTKDEILQTVDAICFGPTSNSIITPLLEKLLAALPHSKISDLMCWNNPQLTLEQIVDEAIRQEADYCAGHGSRAE